MIRQVINLAGEVVRPWPKPPSGHSENTDSINRALSPDPKAHECGNEGTAVSEDTVKQGHHPALQELNNKLVSAFFSKHDPDLCASEREVFLFLMHAFRDELYAALKHPRPAKQRGKESASEAAMKRAVDILIYEALHAAGLPPLAGGMVWFERLELEIVDNGIEGHQLPD